MSGSLGRVGAQYLHRIINEGVRTNLNWEPGDNFCKGTDILSDIMWGQKAGPGNGLKTKTKTKTQKQCKQESFVGAKWSSVGYQI